MHKGEPIRELEAQFAGRLIFEMLPPWAPMLNPVEPLWSWLKWERLKCAPETGPLRCGGERNG